MRALELVADISRRLTAVERQIVGHAWLDDLEAGRISTGALAVFAGEQLLIIPSDRRSFAGLAERSPDQPARAWLEYMVAGEDVALEALEAFAAAVGMTADRRAAFEPAPGCQAYPSYVARLTRDGSPAEVAGAFLANLESWGANCGRVRDAMVGGGRLTDEDVRFFSVFATPPADFMERTLAVIQAGIDAGVEPAAVTRAARLLQSYELLYWDSLPR